MHSKIFHFPTKYTRNNLKKKPVKKKLLTTKILYLTFISRTNFSVKREWSVLYKIHCTHISRSLVYPNQDILSTLTLSHTSHLTLLHLNHHPADTCSEFFSHFFLKAKTISKYKTLKIMDKKLYIWRWCIII